MLVLGRELRLPDLLMSNSPPRTYQARSEYMQEMAERLEKAHKMLREHKLAVRQEDGEEPLLFQNDDLVLAQNTKKRKWKILSYD